MGRTLDTNGAEVSGTSAYFEGFDAIRHSEAQPGEPVRLSLTDGGLVDLSDELGTVAATIATAAGIAAEVVTGAGDDTLWGSSAADTLRGGEGDDILDGNGGADSLFGGAGNDHLHADSSARVVDGGTGTDTLHIHGGSLADMAITGVEVLRLGSGSVAGTLAQLDSFDRIEMGYAGQRSVSLDIVGGGTADLSDELGSLAVHVSLNTTAGVSLVTGAGDDWVSGRSRFSGNDTLDGGAGNDALWGLDGDDLLVGGAGNDTLYGLSGDDTLLGGDGDDRIGDFASSGLPEPSGITVVDAGAGNDQVDIIFASAGSSANGGAGTDTLYAMDNDLSVFMLRNFETLAFEGTVAGTAGQFEAFSSIYVEPDSALRLVGADTANLSDELGSQGVTVLASDLGNTVVTGAGNDMLIGGAGRDQLTGGLGADALDGGAGNDKLAGGEGADALAGGVGRDVLTGGAGGDGFFFDVTALSAGSADRIADFISGEDRLVFDAAAFGVLGEQIDADEFRLGTRALDRDDQLIYDQGAGKLFFDADGSGAGGKLLVATFVPGTALAASDLGLWSLPLIEF